MKDKAWSGRFREETDKFFEEFSESVSFDHVLALYEIKASKAYAKALKKIGIISEKELSILESALDEIALDIQTGKFIFRKELEDVHMNIERALFERVGEVAFKIHTGRSRNEQVVTDLRLYLREENIRIKGLIIDLIEAILSKAEENLDVVFPGFTHLQHAQPVLFAHWITTYAEALRWHYERLLDWEKRNNLCPLGSSAFAGCGFPLDRYFLSRELGFTGPILHSVFAVSSRDFVMEFLFVLTLIMLDLSRLCEELILWMSPEFSFIDLPDRFCTGSSLMPQKKNPDGAELIRGKTSAVLGNLLQLLSLVKNLPLSYNRDLQEDKPPLFQAIKTTKDSLMMAILLVEGIKIKRERLHEIIREGYLLATELADYLVVKGVPFREAHHLTGRIVRYAEEQGKKLEELTLDEFRSFSELIENDVYQWLTVENALSRRELPGGTGPQTVRSYIQSLRTLVEKWKS